MNASSKREKFKTLLSSSDSIILIGVHDALSAKLVELAGWQALWASSFGFSAVSGLPDANLLTFTENLETIRKIIQSTKLPLIADCDNGYGDLNIFNRVVKEYEIAGVTGICIEDNVFPKRCSFYNKEIKRKLVPISEYIAKIKLATNVRNDKNFFVIARTEAFIAGLGLKEALKRASAYVKAGADAICIHSKKTDASEILKFADLWNHKIPLVAIPTTYYMVHPLVLYKSGYKIIVFANQLLRNTIRSMKAFLLEIRDEKKRVDVFNNKIADLEEVFDITGIEEMKILEKKFSP